MARGVEIRARSLRILFSINGVKHRETLMLNGEPLAPTPANIKYADRLAAEIRDRIKHGTFSMVEYFPASGAGNILTVETQLTEWLSAQRLEESTRAGYESAAKFWTGYIGSVPIRALKHSDILKALANRPELSGKTVNNYVSVLRESLQMAVIDRILSDNPADDVPRAKWQKEPPDPFTREEAERIISKLDGQVQNMVETWFWTGLRTSEIFGLKWANVDLSAGALLVNSAIVRGVTKERTKTGIARTVILNSRALVAIQRQRQHTQMAAGAVFHDPRYDSPWNDERAFRRSYWTPTLKRLSIRYRRPYNMRHSYATQMLMAGMNPAFCARQLGHSVEIFLRTYSKWLDGDANLAEMARLEMTLGALAVPREGKL